MLTQCSSFLLNAFLICCMLIHLNRALEFNRSSQCVRLLFCSSSTAPHKSVQHPMASEITLHAQTVHVTVKAYIWITTEQ